MNQREDFDNYYLREMNEEYEESEEEITEIQENNSTNNKDIKIEKKNKFKRPISKRLTTSRKRYNIYRMDFKMKVVEEVNKLI